MVIIFNIMADYIDTHNDFFYPKSSSGLESFIRLRHMRKLVCEALNECLYIFPRTVAHDEVIKALDRSLSESINILDDVLSKTKTKKSRQGLT